jgi:hypothetical protein
VEELIEKSDDATPETPEIIEEVVAEETEDVTATQDLPTEEVLEKEEKKPDYEGMIQGGGKSEPADKELYNRLIGEAKKKFDVYPSAVANAWVTNEYKKRGGKYKPKKAKKFADAVIVPKSLMSDLLKFDAQQYEAARDALANLISVEAGEMKEGHNEINSISHLLQAVAHLHSWYEGEESEGEVMEQEDIELSAHNDSKKMMPKKGETEKEFKARCKEAGMSDKEADDCFKTYMAAEEDTEKNHHDDKDTKKTHHKSAEEKAEETTEEVVEEKDSEPAIAESDVEAIVEKAVKSATESIRSEVASLVSAKEAALEKAATLESELATAKSLAVGGGPKRTTTPIDSTTNDLLTKALVYKAKMNAATDPTLVKGYKALHDEFMQKAEASTK